MNGCISQGNCTVGVYGVKKKGRPSFGWVLEKCFGHVGALLAQQQNSCFGSVLPRLFLFWSCLEKSILAEFCLSFVTLNAPNVHWRFCQTIKWHKCAFSSLPLNASWVKSLWNWNRECVTTGSPIVQIWLPSADLGSACKLAPQSPCLRQGN